MNINVWIPLQPLAHVELQQGKKVFPDPGEGFRITLVADKDVVQITHPSENAAKNLDT